MRSTVWPGGVAHPLRSAAHPPRTMAHKACILNSLPCTPMLDHHRFTVDNDILLRDLGDILNHRVLFRFLDLIKDGL